MNIYLVMVFGGLIGITLHILVAMATINRKMEKANFRMVWKQYWSSEYLSLLMSVVAFVGLLYVSSEYVDLNNLERPDYSEPIKDRLFHFKLAAFIKTTSILAGFFSDYVVYKWLGVTEKKLKQKFDEIEKSMDNK